MDHDQKCSEIPLGDLNKTSSPPSSLNSPGIPVLNAYGEAHEHRPFAEPICNLTTIDTFHTVFQEVIRAHQAYARAGILHSNLTPDQIKFHRWEDGSVSGMLLDCDVSLPPDLAPFYSGADPLRTYPHPVWLAHEKLTRPLNVQQLYRHDLESLILIFRWYFEHSSLDGYQALHPVDSSYTAEWNINKWEVLSRRGKDTWSSEKMSDVYKFHRDYTKQILNPLWDLVYEGNSLVKEVLPPTRQDLGTLYGRLTYHRVMNIFEREKMEEVIRALAIRLPADEESENRIPLIQDFTSLRYLSDFRTAFIDVVEAHRRLFVETKKVHADLTPHNFRFMENSSGNGVTGIFVDLDPLDLAPGEVAHEDPLSIPFQAHDLVMGDEDGDSRHYRHDLESFFYILLWFSSCNTIGKGEKMVTRVLGSRYNEEWFSVAWNFLRADDSRYRNMCRWRDSFIRSHREFPRITGSFEELKDTCLKPLWHIFNKIHVLDDSDSEATDDLLMFETFMAAIRSPRQSTTLDM